MSKGKKIRTAKEIEQIFNVLRVIVAIAIALLFAFVVILLVSDDPVDSISKFVVGPVTTTRRFGEVVSKMVPLLFTGAFSPPTRPIWRWTAALPWALWVQPLPPSTCLWEIRW